MKFDDLANSILNEIGPTLGDGAKYSDSNPNKKSLGLHKRGRFGFPPGTVGNELSELEELKVAQEEEMAIQADAEASATAEAEAASADELARAEVAERSLARELSKTIDPSDPRYAIAHAKRFASWKKLNNISS
jgi:hypothetical protein